MHRSALLAFLALSTYVGCDRTDSERTPPTRSAPAPSVDTENESNSSASARPQDDRPTIQVDEGMRRVVREAFLATHDGYSTDEVVLDDRLNTRFLEYCQRVRPGVAPFDCNWILLNLRKAGSLGPVVTKRRRDRHDAYIHAAEIAARLMHDKHELTMDRVLCEPARRREFDQIAQSMAPDVSAYRLRKAALRLRKSRQLRPELVLRVADWGKEILILRADEILENPDIVPRQPGVYIFRDSTG